MRPVLPLTRLLLFVFFLGGFEWSADSKALTEKEKSRLHEALGPLHEQYDPAEQMIRRPFSSPGYHTTLKGGMVHPTRDSLNYAVALLDTADPELLKRAEGILTRIVSLQDQDPQSRTYGIWSWFMEEPLSQMSPPDWNWADFCGVQLLQVVLDHRERLNPDLLSQVDAAIRHAANSIRKRNVGPGYTNIAIMGTYVTLVAAELYQIPDLMEYALNRLRRFYDYTKEQGAFTEYNSPTYTLVALKELARLREHVNSSEAKPLIEELYNLAWKEIAVHFHVPTRQWSGPHSRAYRTLMTPDSWAFLARTTENRINFGSDKPSLDEHRVPTPCPPQFESYFLELAQPREVVQTFLRGKPSIIGTTYLHPKFSLGSVNKGDFWNQRRPLLAYWGTAEKPAYLQVRFLHDNYDFAAAQFFSSQAQGRALCGVSFATDGGDTHVSLDRIKNGKLRARDFRLRFEFGGSASGVSLQTPNKLNDPVHFRFGDVTVSLAVPVAVFGEESLIWEKGKDEGKSWLDLVLLNSEEREIDLRELEKAAVGFCVQFSSELDEFPNPAAEISTDRSRLRWAGLELTCSIQPAPAKLLHFESVRQGL